MAQGKEATTATRLRFWRFLDEGMSVTAAAAQVRMSRRWAHGQVAKGRPAMAGDPSLTSTRLRGLHEQLQRAVAVLRDGKLPEADYLRSVRLDTRRRDALRACSRAAVEIEALAGEVRT